MSCQRNRFVSVLFSYLFSICLFLFLFFKFQDILENDDIKLDWMFKSSLISDMCNVSHVGGGRGRQGQCIEGGRGEARRHNKGGRGHWTGCLKLL